MDNNITMVRGDTASFGIKFKDYPNIELDSAFLSVKTNYDAGNYLFQKKLGNGISKVGDGEYTVRIAPSDTENLEADSYCYDFKIGVNGDIFTILRGLLIILPRVTNYEEEMVWQ